MIGVPRALDQEARAVLMQDSPGTKEIRRDVIAPHGRGIECGAWPTARRANRVQQIGRNDQGDRGPWSDDRPAATGHGIDHAGGESRRPGVMELDDVEDGMIARERDRLGPSTEFVARIGRLQPEPEMGFEEPGIPEVPRAIRELPMIRHPRINLYQRPSL